MYHARTSNKENARLHLGRETKVHITIPYHTEMKKGPYRTEVSNTMGSGTRIIVDLLNNGKLSPDHRSYFCSAGINPGTAYIFFWSTSVFLQSNLRISKYPAFFPYITFLFLIGPLGNIKMVLINR